MASAIRARATSRGEWESFDSLWRRFENKCNDADIINEYRKHDFYEKKSIRNRKRKMLARVTERKRQESQSIDFKSSVTS